MQKSKQVTKRLFTGMLAGAMALTLFAGTAFADDSSASYTVPTSPMSVDDNIITATAHRAASPAIDMMGLNAVSGFGMINGSAPTTLSEAMSSAAVGIWGSSVNDNPDPYYWNYFYNFYADAVGAEKSSDALMNPSVAASPMQADTTLKEEYGNVSVSLSTRPDIALGCASKGAAESDTHGYDSQIETINSFTKDSPYYQDGDEDYSPYLVAYTRSTLVDMISSVKNLGAAMDEITEETGKTGRYGDGGTIATNYENFIYGLQSYILSKIADGTTSKKTVAIVTDVDKETNTFTLANSSTQEATSSNRYVEYTDIVGDNIAASEGTVTVNAEELAKVDVIILSNFNSEGFTDATGQAVTFYELLKEQSTYNKKMMIIENYPNTLYGITMNSVENAMGMAYIVSYMYSDVLDIDPVSMCAYYYQQFYHISDLANLQKTIAINFKNVTLPEGMASTLSDDYDPTVIEGQIVAGETYYVNNKDAFADNYIGKANWNISEEDIPEVHAWDNGKELVAATCTKAGVELYTCKLCGKTNTAVIPATGHTWNKGEVTTKATCTKAGVKTYTCTVCGETKTESIKATGHTLVTIPATATMKAGKKCSVCGTIIVAPTAKADNSVSKISPTSKSYKANAKTKKLAAKKTFTIKATPKTSAKVTYKKASGNSKITVSSSGKVTVKKGLKKGTYKVKVKVTMAATDTTKETTVTKTITIKVK